MQNPFPGMNPWLELNSTGVHARMVVYAGDQLQDYMPPGLRVQVEEDITIDTGDDSAPRRRLRPDVHLVESWDGGSAGTAVLDAIDATRGVLVMEDPPTQRHLEIVDAFGVLVTAIEFLSLSNKTAGGGLGEYRSKQRTYLQAGVNLVEIDLLRDGSFALAMREENFPGLPAAAYKAAVFRSADPRERLAFPIGLREPLPRLPIPLRATDKPAILDLQPLVDRCCTKGGYTQSDYRRSLRPPLSPEDAAWAGECLRAAGMQD